MLKIHKFHVSFIIQGVQFNEEYSLPYRTEEWELLTEKRTSQEQPNSHSGCERYNC